MQAFPSLHELPLLTFEYCVVLAVGWHVAHVFVPLLAPAATQAPPIAQKPALSVGAAQSPVVALHVPAVWHASGAVQVTGLLPVQVPAWHESVCVQAFPSLHAVPFVAAACVHAPAEHASTVQGFPSSHDVEHPVPPNPSWYVIIAPEFSATSFAASAPTKLDVLTVTTAFVATNSAWMDACEFRLMLEDVSQSSCSALAVSPDPDAGPIKELPPKFAAPVTESTVGALTITAPPLFSVRDEKTYVPPVRESVAPALTTTLP